MSTKGKEYKLAIRIAGIVDKSYNTALVSANANLRTFKATMNAMDKDFTKLDRGFSKIMNVGSKCFQAVATAAGVATVAIGAAVAASVKIGSEFEAQMSTVQAISGATGSELEQLTDKARELAKTSVFSATEVGNAMEYMGMAGWETNQILDGISGVLALAAASGEDFATVSDIVTDDLTAFNMTAEETERMVNVMAQAAMNSNTTVAKMGETFKYAGAVAGAMNYTIEDMAIATGLMASAGVKESLAGTSLRNIITRMAKPTKEAQEAMDALGLSLEKDSGEMYSFLEIMQQIRSSMADMTETQKAYYAAELAGQRGMTGLLAIANASDEEFQKLTEAIYNAEGAAERMAEIRLDNLSGDVQIFKDTLSDAGIELYYQFNDELRDITQKGTELVKAGTTKIPQMFRKISIEFPTFQRKFKKFAQPVFSGIMDGGKWIIKNGRGIISVLAGIGATLAAYKVASTGVHFINALMGLTKLNPVTLSILGVTAAVGGLTAAFTAYKLQERKLIDENLADHFGSITLSMEELQRVAEYIIQTNNLGAVKKAMEAFDGLDEYAAAMSNAVSELDRMNWQVSIGMKLDEDEQESYKQAIQEYVDAAQNYALQGQYAISLSLSATLGEDDLEQSNIVDKINQFYADKYDDLQNLGTQLNEAVTEAFNDGLLEIDEIEKITQIQQQMAEIEKQLALGEYEGTLSAISIEFAGTELTADSYKNMLDELHSASETAAEAYKDAYIKNYAAITAAYEGGYLTEEEYQRSLDNEKITMNNGIVETNLKAMSFAMNTIYDLYGEDIAKYNEAANAVIAAYGKTADDGVWEYAPGSEWYRMENQLNQEAPDNITRKAINDLMEPMQDQIDWFNSMLKEWDNLTPELQEELKEMRDRVMPVLGVAGEGDDQTKDLMYRIENLSDYDGSLMKEWVDQRYDEYFGYAYDNARAAANQLTSDTQQLIDENFANGFDVEASVNIMLRPSLANAMNNSLLGLASNMSIPSSQEGQVSSTAKGALAWIDHNATGGIIKSKELSWLAENGPESVIPLDGSQRAISLWEKTGQLLGMDSLLDRYDIGSGGQNTIAIEYNPTLQFYGAAPSRDDISDALHISQDEFEDMMERYLKTSGRVSFLI